MLNMPSPMPISNLVRNNVCGTIANECKFTVLVNILH